MIEEKKYFISVLNSVLLCIKIHKEIDSFRTKKKKKKILFYSFIDGYVISMTSLIGASLLRIVGSVFFSPEM